MVSSQYLSSGGGRGRCALTELSATFSSLPLLREPLDPSHLKLDLAPPNSWTVLGAEATLSRQAPKERRRAGRYGGGPACVMRRAVRAQRRPGQIPVPEPRFSFWFERWPQRGREGQTTCWKG